MSKNSFKWKKIRNQYFTYRNILTSIIVSLFIIPFILIFIYALQRRWYDGMSVGAMIYISIGLLTIIFDLAQFKTWTKLKNLFAIKKENSEELSTFERMQMKILNISDDTEVQEKKKINKKQSMRFIAFWLIVYGIILLSISLPFCF